MALIDLTAQVRWDAAVSCGDSTAEIVYTLEGSDSAVSGGCFSPIASWRPLYSGPLCMCDLALPRSRGTWILRVRAATVWGASEPSEWLILEES